MSITSPTGLPFPVPSDVIERLTGIFSNCNDRVTGVLSRIPTIHEDALDQQLIGHLTQLGPVSTPTSGWIISIETHFLGGGRHFDRWEIADIGVLITFRRGRQVLLSKVALLQSKRLFPKGNTHDANYEESRFRWGFGRLLQGYIPLRGQTDFTFTRLSRYESLDLTGAQATRISAYEGEFRIPVHYLLYNPVALPWSRALPATPPEPALPATEIGCRVLRAASLNVLQSASVTKPSFEEVASLSAPHAVAAFAAGWRLEDFMVSLLLQCHEGRVLGPSFDEAMELLFYRRSYPIAAAFAVNLEMPE